MGGDKIMSSVLDTLNLRFTSDLQVARYFHEQKIAGEICLVKVNNFVTFRLSSTPEVYDILVTVTSTIWVVILGDR